MTMYWVIELLLCEYYYIVYPLQVWKDALNTKQQSPYMNHAVPGAIQNFKFCPYEVCTCPNKYSLARLHITGCIVATMHGSSGR